MATSAVACILLIISMIARGIFSSALWLLALIFLILSYFRIFSRSLERRRQENQWFLCRIRPLTDLRARHREKRRQKNLYCFFKCPQCCTVLRVPKGKGRILITCKNCRYVFERTS